MLAFRLSDYLISTALRSLIITCYKFIETREIENYLCGTHITENHLVGIVFLSGIGPLGPKKHLAKYTDFGPNLAVFGTKIHFLGGGSKTFGTLISGHQ